MTAHAPPNPVAGPGGALRETRPALVRRLLLPRGTETTSKWLLLPVGAILALCADVRLPSAGLLAQLVLLWFVAEQLAYQARYQLNDLRDRRSDAAHPSSARRGRLALPWTRTRAVLVWGSIGLRVLAAVGLAVLALDGRPQQAAVVFLCLVVVVSFAYESARERVRRSEVDPSTGALAGLGLPVLVLVPLGYGLRVWTGFHAASADGAAAVGVLVVLTFLAVSTGTVLLTWALEATSFVEPDGSVAKALGKRAHLALLLRHTGLLDAAPPVPGRPAAADLVLARDRPAGSAVDVKVWDVAAALGLLLAYATAAAAVDADAVTGTALLSAALLSAAAPWAVRRWTSRAPGVWDLRPPWLGRGGLAATVSVELVALVLAGIVIVGHDASHARMLWFPAFVLFLTGSVRTSSYRRGFGPLSPVKRTALWLLRRSERGPQ